MELPRARQLMEQRLADANLRKHCLASAAVLAALAERLGEDPDTWALAGMLHDLDYAETAERPERHGLAAAEMLAGEDLPPEVLQAIKAHNAEALGIQRQGKLDLALTCGETITGLVVATALVYPDKRLASVKPKSVTKRMKEKSFAASVNRDHIRLCEELGIPLAEFAALAVEAMRGVSDDLGL